MLKQPERMIKNIAESFHKSEKLIIQESLKIFLEKKLREIKSKIFEIARKYSISNIKEFEDLYKKGIIEEENTFDDYKILDRLEFEKDEIENFLNEFKK